MSGRRTASCEVAIIPEIRYVWKSKYDRVVDGDTIDLSIDVGFRSTRTERIRLLGVNCPEMKGLTRSAGEAAKRFVEAWLAEHATGGVLVVETFKSDVFGRWLARVWGVDGACLNDALLESGNAVVYDK